MRIQTLLLLARSRTPADRSRVRLSVGALALSGALLLGAFRVARLGFGQGDLDSSVYSNYVAEAGLRSGLVAILVILATLTGGLAVQALRLGTAARERRMAALRLAGASNKQVRRLSVTDAAMAGLAGGLLAGPLYLALSLLLGLLPRVAQVLPGANPVDLVVWPLVVVVMTATGALIGELLHEDNPQPRSERPDSTPRRSGVATGAVLVVVALLAAPLIGYVATTALVVGLAFAMLHLNRLWFRTAGRFLARSGNPVNLLTSAWLTADARSAARMSTLLGCCGFLIGLLIHGLLGIGMSPDIDRVDFFVTGYSMAIVGLLMVVGVAMGALIVGVADQLVDQRRHLASLTALGVDARFLRRVITRQIATVGTPALAGGAAVGMLLGLERVVGVPLAPFDRITLLATFAVVVGSCLFGLAGGVLAGFLLRNQLRDALDPENLRAA
jgi:FtsX-like permease family protein